MKGKNEFLRQFCQPSLSDKDWKNLSILELIEKACPRYLIPTTLDTKKGICVPDYALAAPGSEEARNISVILERIQLSDTKMLDPDLVLEGTKYILDKAVEETFWQKTWSEHLAENKVKNNFRDRFWRITGHR